MSVQPSEATRLEIEAVDRRIEEFAQKADAHGIASQYAEDVVDLTVFAPVLHGRAGVQYLRGLLLQIVTENGTKPQPPNANQFVSKSILVDNAVSPTIAVEWGYGTSHVRIPDGSGDIIDVEGQSLKVLKKVDGKWLITHSHLSFAKPPPPKYEIFKNKLQELLMASKA